jgi:hypothetical protein
MEDHIMTSEQIAAVKTEIEAFSQKSIQYATDDPDLSAHYNRLYRASQMLLNKSIKLEQAAARKKHAGARKEAAEARKNKKQQGTTPSRPTPNSAQSRA